MQSSTKDSKSLDNPVWFITGCSTGFGHQIARHVLELGYRVVITARDTEDIRGLAQYGDALVLELDVTNRSQAEAAVKTAEDHFGGIDVLVNNAGIGYFAAVEESDEAEVRKMFEVNVFGLCWRWGVKSLVMWGFVHPYRPVSTRRSGGLVLLSKARQRLQ
jgi:NAD(P)-dependent dehydrogenase (short-subunit alcohol dehydrogenase family)